MLRSSNLRKKNESLIRLVFVGRMNTNNCQVGLGVLNQSWENLFVFHTDFKHYLKHCLLSVGETMPEWRRMHDQVE